MPSGRRRSAPGDVIGSFMGLKIAEEMSPAARNNAAPIFGILLEGFSLEGVNLIADDA
jgi:hypothetical protein